MLIRVDGVLFKAHRLAWLYVRGCWPSGIVDHKDGNTANNRWSNLRDTTQMTNNHNRVAAQRNSKVGFLGVSPCLSRFSSAIKGSDGIRRHLGVFDTPEEAHLVYLLAKVFYQGNAHASRALQP